MTTPQITLAIHLYEQAHDLREAGLDDTPTNEHAHQLLATT